jgi:hypothetical protein
MFIMRWAHRRFLPGHGAWAAHLVLLVMVSTPVAARGDGITITEWFHGVQVDAPYGLQQDFSYTLENPLHRTLLAQAGSSISSSDVDFAWSEQFGRFLIQSEQVAIATASGLTVTSASGYTWLTTTEPMPLHIDAAWTYSLPVDYMMAIMSVTVVDPQSEVSLFVETQGAGTFPGEPAFGTLSIEGDVMLPPGPTWVLGYYLALDAFEGTQAYAAAGDGHVNFTITPEPATLALLLPLLAMRRRRAGRERGQRA